MVRRLHIDTAADRRRAKELLEHGRDVADRAVTGGPARTPDDFDAQRNAVITAIFRGELDDDTARVLVHDVDLHQAAETHLKRRA